MINRLCNSFRKKEAIMIDNISTLEFIRFTRIGRIIHDGCNITLLDFDAEVVCNGVRLLLNHNGMIFVRPVEYGGHDISKYKPFDFAGRVFGCQGDCKILSSSDGKKYMIGSGAMYQYLTYLLPYLRDENPKVKLR